MPGIAWREPSPIAATPVPGQYPSTAMPTPKIESRLSGPGVTPYFLSGVIDQAVAGVDPTGSFVVNINTNVAPTPGGLALLGAGGLLAARRRRP